MNIDEADTRRREGLTSWEAYGREAVAAQGKKRLTGVLRRRDEKKRLQSLRGLRLGDLRELLSPTDLGQLELTLMLKRAGKISAEEARADLLKLFRERPRSKDDMGTAFRESLQSQMKVGEHGYPFTEAFLTALGRGPDFAGDRKEGEHPMAEALLEESFLDLFGGH